MQSSSDWIDARTAAARLDVKLPTLYAYASRGLVASVPGPRGRGRLYARDAIERLKTRHDARKGHGAVAAGALHWGEPTLETSIAEIRADAPHYRGHSALSLCERGSTFEQVAELLWSGELVAHEPWPAPALKLALPARDSPFHASSYLAALVALSGLRDRERHGASAHDEHVRARCLVSWLASSVGGHKMPARPGGVAERLLASYGVRVTRDKRAALDRALILCAEHELNASTFAVRVTASTGADLYACLGAGLHAHSGPKHGGHSARVEALLREIGQPARAAGVLRERLARGESLPGFGHPLYPGGDPRARALLELARNAKQKPRNDAVLDALRAAMERARHPAPNLDLGLVALCRALALPEGAPGAVFAIGRTAGWIAHALEQRASGQLLRPRARFVPSPEASLARF